MKILIKNGYVVSMVSKPQKADVVIEDGRIVFIGNSDGMADKIIDATNKIVMPGLINAHTHVAMSLFRGYADELVLSDWLSQKMWPIEDKMTAEDAYFASMLSGIEMIKSGTTTFNDLYFFEEETAKMAEKLGMRAILSRCLFSEGEGMIKRAEEEEELYNNWHNKCDGRIKVCVGIHAPNTCPPDTIKKGIQLADKLGTPIHMHYLETKDEIEYMANTYLSTVTEYLKKSGVFNYHVMLAHGVHINDIDIEVLKKISGGIVYNPISNMKLGSGFSPVVKLRRNGINVALGTDGQGSTNTLDMFEEIKLTAYLQKGLNYNPTVITAEDILKMATIEGAKVLGKENEIGTLEVGKKADIIFIKTDKIHLTPENDIATNIVYSANGADIDTAIIDGKLVMQNRKMLNIDEKEVIKQVKKVAKRLL